MYSILSVSTFATVAKEDWNNKSSKDKLATEWKSWKTTWKSVKYNYEQISLTPGKKASQPNFAWYSRMNNQAKVRIAVNKEMKKAVLFRGISNKYKQIQCEEQP